MAPSSDEETKIRLFLVPKTVQPKVEIKTIPKPSPTPPPVSVTGTTASEVTEKVTIKKEVPILEKPAVSGNDAKIELKIGIGKDGSHFDQSPTTDRLIKLDKSPIIDHIRKASFAKNVKTDKISKSVEKLEKVEKNVIKVEEKTETNENENKNGHCDQEEKVEEVKKVKEEVKEVIRPRSNSKMAGLLLSPVANGGRKRKRFVQFSVLIESEPVRIGLGLRMGHLLMV